MSEQNFAGPPSDSKAGTEHVAPPPAQPDNFATVTRPAQADNFATVTRPAQPVASATPVTSAAPRLPMTRRNVLRAAGAAGVVAAAGGAAAYFGTRPDERNTSTAGGGPAAAGPVVAYLRDPAAGVVEIFVGTKKTTIRDTALAARLASAAR